METKELHIIIDINDGVVLSEVFPNFEPAYMAKVETKMIMAVLKLPLHEAMKEIVNLINSDEHAGTVVMSIIYAHVDDLLERVVAKQNFERMMLLAATITAEPEGTA